MGEEAETSEWPTREFFESNAKAEDIREACIPILEKIHRLLYDTEIVDDADNKSKLYAELEIDNGVLLELGVTKNMMMGKTMEEYKRSPLVAAQYLAGQLIRMTGEEIPSESEAITAMGEFSVSQDEDFRMAKSDQVPKQSHDFRVRQSVFRFVKNGFAIDDSELGLPKEY